MHTIEYALKGFAVARNGVPIYVQLRDHLAATIAAGTVRPGEQMPTMRQMAVALRIDINTVRHAYDDLERAGLITLARGRGTFVAGTAGDARSTGPVDALARQALKSARIAGVNAIEVANRIVTLAQEEDQP